MISTSNLVKKRRRFSSQDISFQLIPLKHNQALPISIPFINNKNKQNNKSSLNKQLSLNNSQLSTIHQSTNYQSTNNLSNNNQITNHQLTNHQINNNQISNKFQKIQNKRINNARKSMDFDRIAKCEQNLDILKRQTEWKNTKIDNIQFQKIIQRRKQKSRFNFNTVQLRSIQHRSLNSFNQYGQSEDINKSQLLEYRLKHEKRFSLQKERSEFIQLQKQLKVLNQKQIQQKTKQKIFNQLIKIVKQQIQQLNRKQYQHDRQLSINEHYSNELNKQQHKTDIFIKLTNDIQQKIFIYKKDIFSLRSQRVVYSSIFKQLERQIKYNQNIYKQSLINAIQYMQSIQLFKLYSNVNYGQQYERSQSPMNSYAQYKNLFSTIFKSSGVKFIGNINFNMGQQQQLNTKINSNTAINYYTQSRKVIILPRYKQHYQSSRKKIKLQQQQYSYQLINNQINKFYQTLDLFNYQQIAIGEKKDFIINNNNYKDIKSNNQIYKQIKPYNKQIKYDNKESKDNKQIKDTMNNSKQQFYPTQNIIQSNNTSIHKQHHLNKQNSIQNIITMKFNNTNSSHISNQIQSNASLQIIKSILTQLPNKNQQLFQQIQNIDLLINQTYSQIQKENIKLKIFQNSQPNSININTYSNLNQIIQQTNNNSKQLIFQKQLSSIKAILLINDQIYSENYLFSHIQKLQNIYIQTKTYKLFDKPQQTNITAPNSKRNQSDTDRSNISIKFKKIDQNVSINQNTHFDKKDILTRGPKTLNSILKNIQVYDSYERAFQRMDFQKQYEIQKNKKKRTLIRRDGMVSLGLLKKQTQQKTKFLKRQSSNKKQNDRA